MTEQFLECSPIPADCVLVSLLHVQCNQNTHCTLEHTAYTKLITSSRANLGFPVLLCFLSAPALQTFL